MSQTFLIVDTLHSNREFEQRNKHSSIELLPNSKLAHWQSFTRDSQETFKTFVARAYLPEKKWFSCCEKCVQTIRSPQNVSHPSRCHQHCQESNSSLEYLSISFWWCFGGPLPSSILEKVLCLVINVPKNLSQLRDGLL